MFTCDVGRQRCGPRALKMNGKRKLIGSCNHGSMANAMPHALGAQAAFVIFNNGALGFVELEMKASGILETAVSLTNPDFSAVAQAAGLFARRVEDPGDLTAAAQEVLAHPRPRTGCRTARQGAHEPAPLITPPSVERAAGSPRRLLQRGSAP